MIAQRLTSRMIALALLLATAAGACAANLEPARPEAVLLDSSTVQVPMDLGHGRPVLDTWVNGHGPYRFILDPGAGSSMIDSTLAHQFGLRVLGRTRSGDARNPRTVAADVVRLDSLRAGGLLLRGLSLATMNLRKMMGPSAGGVLGLSDLSALLVSLDYPRSLLTLTHGELPAGEPGVVAYHSPHDLEKKWANIGSDALQDLTITVDQRHHRLRLERTGSGGRPVDQQDTGK